MRFEEAYKGCKSGRLAQAEAALLLGVCDRTFRRYMGKYDEGGLDALMDKRLTQALHRCASHESDWCARRGGGYFPAGRGEP